MSYDIIKGEQDDSDWSCGASDLPASAKGYVPETFWRPEHMERKLSEIMSKGGAPFGLGKKPSREEALKELASYMRAKKIGPMDASAGIGAEVGSILFPRALSDKIDDIRYDVRNTGGAVAKGVFALAGALAFLGFAKVYKAASRGRA